MHCISFHIPGYWREVNVLRVCDGSSVLRYASAAGCMEAVRLLITCGAHPTLGQPLHWEGPLTICKTHLPIVKLLVRHGATLDVSTQSGLTALGSFLQEDCTEDCLRWDLMAYLIRENAITPPGRDCPLLGLEYVSNHVDLFYRTNRGMLLYLHELGYKFEYLSDIIYDPGVQQELGLSQEDCGVLRYHQGVPRLLSLCRRTIRECLGSPLSAVIGNLPISLDLQDFIAFDELR